MIVNIHDVLNQGIFSNLSNISSNKLSRSDYQTRESNPDPKYFALLTGELHSSRGSS